MTTFPSKLEGLVHEVLNLTVNVAQTDDGDEVTYEEIFWEPSISYITPVGLDTAAYIGPSNRRTEKMNTFLYLLYSLFYILILLFKSKLNIFGFE